MARGVDKRKQKHPAGLPLWGLTATNGILARNLVVGNSRGWRLLWRSTLGLNWYFLTNPVRR